MTYEYKCNKCGYQLETSLRSDSHKCPSCEKGNMSRIYHAPTIRFIGGGFTKNSVG